MATESVRIPNIDDLLVPATTAEDPETIARAAANVLDPLTEGIGAVGELMFWASQHPDFDMQQNMVRRTGLLLELLSQLQHGVLAQFANGTHEAEARKRQVQA